MFDGFVLGLQTAQDLMERRRAISDELAAINKLAF
jgi:hypothetical protein